MTRTFLFAICLALFVGGSMLAGGLGIGGEVPEFTVESVEGADVNSSAISGDVTVAIFVATQCPVSNDYNGRMKSIYTDYEPKGVKFVFINSNKAEDAAEVKQHAVGNGFPFQVYKDPGNIVADLFGAERTPEVYVIKAGKLVYHGRIDDAQKGEVKDRTLRKALDAILAGNAPEKAETRAFGCTIKKVT